jgi:GLPGLI family protein
MNKTLLTVLTLFLVTNLCFSQESGIVTYTITHDWIKRNMATQYISKEQRDRMAYVWAGDNTWSESAEVKFNPDAYRYDKKEDEEDQQWRKPDDYIIYRDRDHGETFDVMTVLNKQYVIKDSIPCQSWKIKNDMKEIAGRICMNASWFDPIREKEVMAWFALDLPIPIGPNRYCGLPGMILEVNEANGAVVYTATAVLLSEDKIEIEKPEVKKKRKVITYQEYNDIITKHINDCKKMQRPYFWGGLPF